jgi:hypothetical protein
LLLGGWGPNLWPLKGRVGHEVLNHAVEWSAKSEIQMWVSKEGSFFGVQKLDRNRNMASVFCGPKLEQIDQVHFSNGICLGHEPWIVSARIMTVQAGCMIHTQEKQINMVIINTLRSGTTITMFFS